MHLLFDWPQVSGKVVIIQLASPSIHTLLHQVLFCITVLVTGYYDPGFDENRVMV